MKTNKTRVFSPQTRNNFLLDVPMLLAGLASVLTGIYFLFLPVGGFQGGRNPLYGIVIFFERHTWGDIHTWSSVIIMALAVLHIPIHWDWITKMTSSGVRAIFGKSKLNKFSQFNLLINILIGLSGLVCGLSGLYFLFEPVLVPLGSSGWLFTDLTWDMIHTWSGVVVTAAAILHFAIHWRWVTKVFSKYWGALQERIQTAREERLSQPVSLPVEKAS
jgi:hypothetical protein